MGLISLCGRLLPRFLPLNKAHPEPIFYSGRRHESDIYRLISLWGEKKAKRSILLSTTVLVIAQFVSPVLLSHDGTSFRLSPLIEDLRRSIVLSDVQPSHFSLIK